MYDASAKRWLSEDPISFAGGDANLYRYVGNNPTNATDPSGLVASGRPGNARTNFLQFLKDKFGITEDMLAIQRGAISSYGCHMGGGSYEADWYMVLNAQYRKKYQAVLSQLKPGSHEWSALRSILDYTWDVSVGGDLTLYSTTLDNERKLEVGSKANTGIAPPPVRTPDYFGSACDGIADGACMFVNAATFHQIDRLNNYVNQVVAENGGLYGTANVAGHVAAYAAEAALVVGAWTLAGFPTYGIAVGPGQGATGLHFSYGATVEGSMVWQQAAGATGEMWIVNSSLTGTWGSIQGIPVLSNYGVLTLDGAYNCGTAAASALARGWWIPLW